MEEKYLTLEEQFKELLNDEQIRRVSVKSPALKFNSIHAKLEKTQKTN